MRLRSHEGFLVVFITFITLVLTAVPVLAGGISGGISTMTGGDATKIHNGTAAASVAGAANTPQAFSVGGSCTVGGNTSIGFSHEEGRTVMVGGNLFEYKVNEVTLAQQMVSEALEVSFGIGYMTTVAAGATGKSGVVGDFSVVVPIYLWPAIEVVLTKRLVMINGGGVANALMMGLTAARWGAPGADRSSRTTAARSEKPRAEATSEDVPPPQKQEDVPAPVKPAKTKKK